MKKSQVITSALFASVLSLTSILAPLVYAVEGDASAGVVEEVNQNDLTDRVVELLNSLEFEPSAEDSAKFTALQENAAYTTPEIMTKFNKILVARYGSASLSNLTAVQVAGLLDRFPMAPELETIVGIYTGEIESNELSGSEILPMLKYFDKVAIENDVRDIAELDEDVVVDENFDIDNPSTWGEGTTKLIAALVAGDINNFEYNPKGTHAASIQELADFYDIYDDVIASAHAQETLAALEDGTHEDSQAYEYWKAFNAFMDTLATSGDMSVEEFAAAIDAFEEAAKKAGAYVEMPVEPVYMSHTITEEIAENFFITVSGEFAAEHVILEVSPVEHSELFANHRQVAYDIVIRDQETNEILQPKEGTKATVTIDLPEGFDIERDIEVYYINENDQPVSLTDVEVSKDGKVSFKVEHFSLYALVQDNNTILGSTVDTIVAQAPKAGTIASSNARTTATATAIAGFLSVAGVIIAAIARRLSRKN